MFMKGKKIASREAFQMGNELLASKCKNSGPLVSPTANEIVPLRGTHKCQFERTLFQEPGFGPICWGRNRPRKNFPPQITTPGANAPPLLNQEGSLWRAPSPPEDSGVSHYVYEIK